MAQHLQGGQVVRPVDPQGSCQPAWCLLNRHCCATLGSPLPSFSAEPAVLLPSLAPPTWHGKCRHLGVLPSRTCEGAHLDSSARPHSRANRPQPGVRLPKYGNRVTISGPMFTGTYLVGDNLCITNMSESASVSVSSPQKRALGTWHRGCSIRRHDDLEPDREAPEGGEVTMDYDAVDKWACLSILKICPRHGQPLQPVAFCQDVWGCATCKETWHLP